ncbi:MAG: hypothetical protein NVS4B6_27490 [Mycobacterium sp.]
MAEWQSRPLDSVYPVIFIDAVNVKIRDGNVANRPVYIALAVTVEGTRDILGLWAGEHGDGEGAKFWARVLSEKRACPRNRHRVAASDHPEMHRAPAAQQLPPRVEEHWAALAKDLQPICTAPSESAALDAFVALTEAWGHGYPAIIKLWESAWPELVPFLAVRNPHSDRDLHDKCH